MPHDSLHRLANIALRFITLGSKFVFIFVLARLLRPDEVGLYGLLTATISYALMALGFDFYTFTTRELINTDRKLWAALLRDQSVFYCITYVVIVPLCFLIFWMGFLPWTLALWFFPLLLLEHAGQEFNRLLVAMSEPLWASLVLFLRNGLWAVVAAVSMWLLPDHRHLGFVFAVWSISSFLACLLAASRLRHLDRATLSYAINWDWIKRGARVAVPFVPQPQVVRRVPT